MPKSTSKPLQDFEKSLEQLEAIVSKMEQGELSLEKSLEAFEEGVKLTRTCQDTLKKAEQRVHTLIQEGDTLSERPLQNED